MATIKLFEGMKHAQLYSRFRFSYPTELYDRMKVFLKDHGVGNDLMVDIGCGSGQSTFPWSKVFTRCVGTDISEAQISYAKEKIDKDTINIEFEISSSDKLSFSDQSVDMISCGQAWHWLEHSTTIPEIQRVLKKPGCVAIYGYSRPTFENSKAEHLQEIFYHNTLNGYWNPNRYLVDNKLLDTPFPYPIIERQEINYKKKIHLSDYIGYIQSWSGYIAYCEKNPNNIALETLEKDIKNVLTEEKDGENIMDVIIPYFLLLSVKN